MTFIKFLIVTICMLIIISCYSLVLAQQSYLGDPEAACSSTNHNIPTLSGYSYNGQSLICDSYLSFRSQPPYNTISAIATLLNSDKAEMPKINNISDTELILEHNTFVYVPLRCSGSGQYYRATASKIFSEVHGLFPIANDTFQGLTTCQAIQDQNNLNSTDFYNPRAMLIPLRCACPTTYQMESGIKYLLTYIVTNGDTLSGIISWSGVDNGSGILEANQLSADSTIYPFTTLLIPIKDQLPASPQRPWMRDDKLAPSPSQSASSEKKSNNTGAIIGGTVGTSAFIAALAAVAESFGLLTKIIKFFRKCCSGSKKKGNGEKGKGEKEVSADGKSGRP